VHGLCSNYLCDCKPGDELVMTGPAGTALLLNDNPWNKRIVCVSTGAAACRRRVLNRPSPTKLQPSTACNEAANTLPNSVQHVILFVGTSIVLLLIEHLQNKRIVCMPAGAAACRRPANE
jgi:hypothetical protein